MRMKSGMIIPLTMLGVFSLLNFVSCNKKTVDDPSTKTGALEPQKKSQIWTCPMHPQIKKDGPGTCPICGMNLVLAEGESEQGHEAHQDHQMPSADKPSGHAPFKLSMTRQQMIGVRVGTAEKRLLFKSIEAAGRVAFDPELYTAQNEYIEALKQQARVRESPIVDVKHSAARMVESAKLRLKVLGLSDQQIANLTESGVAGGSLLVPKPGETLWIYAEVFEMDLGSIRPGLEARVSGGSLDGQEISGKVASVDRVINPTTRTAKVRILISNTRAMLRPEAYVDVSIRAPLGEQVVVPFDAVLDTGKEAWVFVVKENGTFDPRLVTIRFRAGDEVAIESGVMAGEKIVTSANFLIDSESRLKGVLAAQSEGSAASQPSCPKGQHWDAPMSMCMPDIEK